MSKFLDLDGLSYFASKVKGDIELNKANIVTIQDTISQTYNSADCNVSVFLQQDNGVIDESTYYNSSESKMHFRMYWRKNQFRYWDTEDEVWTYKYRYEYFGLIATNNAAKKTWLEINIPETANETYVKKSSTVDSQLDNAGAYTWNKSSVSVGDIWYIRPYVVMTDLQFGNQFIKYGAVYKVTASVPCTIECDTLSCTELTATEKQNENNISAITPTVSTVEHTATQTTNYEQVTGLTYTLAAGKTAYFNVSAINQRGAIRGIKITNSTTLIDDNIVAISETSANYRALTCGGIYTNTGSSDVTLYVFVKFYSPVKNAITLSAYQL